MNDQTGSGDVTRLLESARAGERSAVDQLMPMLYDELRRIAQYQLDQHSDPPTLQATSLVHEAYLKLAGSAGLSAESRAHMLSIAARAMRQVLVDQARRRGAQKRGGAWQQTTLADEHQAIALRMEDVVALNEALERLDPRQRQVVESKFFAGMDEREIALALGISERTVRREWIKARAWLVVAMSPIMPGA